jgi:hypothetical protein
MDEKMKALVVYALVKFNDDLSRRNAQIEHVKADEWLNSPIGINFDPDVLKHLQNSSESLAKMQFSLCEAIKFIQACK